MSLIMFIIATVLFAIAAFVPAPSRSPLHLGWLAGAFLALGLALGS